MYRYDLGNLHNETNLIKYLTIFAKDNELGITKEDTTKIIEKGELTLSEQQHFVEQVSNRAAYFKGSIFANDQYRDEEMRIQFTINSKFDGFNISKEIEFGKPDFDNNSSS